MAPWAFVGFDTIPQAAEEFKFSPKKSKIIMILSILFGALVYIVLSTITASVFPSQYNNWVEYINDLPNLEGMLSLPTFHAASQLLGNTGLLFIGLAVLAAILSGVIGFYMAASRLFYSMAKENVLPLWFGKLHENYHTPANAILFIMAISMIAPFLGRNALGWIVDMSSIGAAIGYGYTSVAALKYAKKSKIFLIEITGCIWHCYVDIF
ncbi:MAG: APC family permease [Sellimonas intestinalis]